MDFSCEYFFLKSAMHFQSVSKGNRREQKKHRCKSQNRKSTGLSKTKSQRGINRRNDERRGGETVTAMRQKFTTNHQLTTPIIMDKAIKFASFFF